MKSYNNKLETAVMNKKMKKFTNSLSLRRKAL